MKKSIGHYIDTHKLEERPFSDGWIKATFEQGEPTLLGHRTDVRIYKNEKFGMIIYLYSEEDSVNLEIDIPSNMLSYEEMNELRIVLKHVKNSNIKLVLSEKPPTSALSFESPTVIIVANQAEMSMHFVIPEINSLCSVIDHDHFLLNNQKIGEIKDALANNDQDKIAKLVAELCIPEQFVWEIKDNYQGRASICSVGRGSQFEVVKEAVRTIQKEFKNISDELLIDIDQFIDEKKAYYHTRRQAFLDHYNRDASNVASYLQGIFQSHLWADKAISVDAQYSVEYINNLLAWYLGNQCYPMVACIYHELKKTLDIELARNGRNSHVIYQEFRHAREFIASNSLSGASQPERDMHLPLFCEATIDLAGRDEKSAGQNLVDYAIKLLNELSRGDDFKAPLDRNDFNSSFIVPLAQKLGETRAKLANQSQLVKPSHEGAGVITENEHMNTEHDRIELLNQSTSRRLQFSDKNCFKTPSVRNMKCTIL
jgi:hypothetical protein